MRAVTNLFRGYEEMYSEERLRPLRTYRYQGVDKSPISRYILAPYWNWASESDHIYWTVVDGGSIGGGIFLHSRFSQSWARVGIFFVSSPPHFKIRSYITCMWLYSTLDNVDGKQARRTNSSSPLGELFDHGCDALNCSIGGLIQIAAMGMGYSNMAILMLGITFWAFYLPTWEEYHTGVLYLGYVNGPTEGVLTAIGFILISGCYGPGVWHQRVSELFPRWFSGTFLANSPLYHFALAFFAFFIVTMYVPMCLVAVYGACRRKGTSFLNALTQLLPMFAVSTAATMWLCSPYSAIRKTHFPLFAMTFGLGFGKMATKIIYAHLCKRPFPYHSGLMLPLFVGSVLVNLPSIFPNINITHWMEVVYLYLWFIIAIVGYGHWSYHVVRSFCGFLGIDCFRIKQKSN